MAGRLRILCLHGKYQNAEMFALKCAGLQRWLDGIADLDFLEGSHEVIPAPRLAHTRTPTQRTKRQQQQARYRAWWVKDCRGWDDTLFNNIYVKLQTDGPYDEGVLGFSQGATAAGLMCTRSISKKLGFQPKVAVLISGRRSVIHDEDYASGIVSGLSCIHSFGLQDQITQPWKSQQLLQLFSQESDGVVHSHVHSGGHMLPEADEELGKKCLMLASCALVRKYGHGSM